MLATFCLTPRSPSTLLHQTRMKRVEGGSEDLTFMDCINGLPCHLNLYYVWLRWSALREESDGGWVFITLAPPCSTVSAAAGSDGSPVYTTALPFLVFLLPAEGGNRPDGIPYGFFIVSPLPLQTVTVSNTPHVFQFEYVSSLLRGPETMRARKVF